MVLHETAAAQQIVQTLIRLLPKEQSDQGLHCLSRNFCPIIKSYLGNRQKADNVLFGIVNCYLVNQGSYYNFLNHFKNSYNISRQLNNNEV